MQQNFTVKEIASEKEIIADRIMRSLPEWFGIESAIVNYKKKCREISVIAAFNNESEAIGFIALEFHNPYTAEIHVMGVSKVYHRSGVGTLLLNYVIDICKLKSIQLLEVKTLGSSHSDPYYAKTRIFYERKGFIPLEEIEGIWPGLPCLIMILPIRVSFDRTKV